MTELQAVAERQETPKEAARRLSAAALGEGFKPQALHVYRDAGGRALYWRIRCKRADGAKWIRPMHLDGTRYAVGEPPAPPEGKPMFGLDALARADKAAAVWLVEGEACAEALQALGLVAVTSGSSTSAGAADWGPLQGRAVTIWPDNDGPGAKYASEAAAKLQALGCTVALVAEAVTEALPKGGDVVDWLAAHENATAADIEQLPRTAAKAANVANVGLPEPLRRPMPAAAEYPLAALGDVLGAAAEAIHGVVKAPAALCGVSILAAASLAAQAQADVTIDGRAEPLSLWALTIAQSGERKTAVDDWALGAHRQHEKAALAAYDADSREFEAERAAFDSAIAKAKGGKGKSRAAIRAAIDAVGAPPEPPLVPLLTLGEPTLEGAQKQLIKGWPSLGLFSSDAGEFLGGYSMGREQKTRTAAAMSKLWDSGSFDRVRAKADEVSGKYYGRRLALHLMTQPVIAEAVLSDATLTGQGFLARCLLAWPESTIGGREYEEKNLTENRALRRYWARMHELLDKPWPLAEGTRNELKPRALTLTADAKALWIQFQNAVEHESGAAGKYATVAAWANKAGAQALRVAGVLTLTESPDATVIDKGAIKRAAELVLWHLGEALRIVGTAAVPRRIRDAEALRDWCQQTERVVLTSNEALRLGPQCVRTAEALNLAMDALTATGWAVPLEDGAELDGKHYRRAWAMVTP